MTLEKIQHFIDDRYIKRGKDIVAQGMVGLEKITTKSIVAYVVGNNIYTVHIEEVHNRLTGTCTCPAYTDFGPCKHMAATCFARMQLNYRPSSTYSEQKEEFDTIASFLSTQTKKQLIDLIMRLAAADPEFMRMVQEETSE
jgi:uncharacterized Zn finger protein